MAQHLIQVAHRCHGPVGGGHDIGDSYGRYFRTCRRDKARFEAADENAIRAAVESYVNAYNRGDAEAVAAHWSESGEWTSPSGQRFQGRRAIEKELENLFAENKGVRIEVVNPSIRIVSADAATEEGTVRVVRPAAPPSDSTYLAVHVKKDGQWKLDSVHETNLPDLPAASPARRWKTWRGWWASGPIKAPTQRSTRALGGRRTRPFRTIPSRRPFPAWTISKAPRSSVDPAAGTIRSWMFDSDGGFGEGTWSKKGNTWIVKFHQILPDGRKALAENVYTLLDDDTFLWKSIAREVDGEYLPNVEEVKMVRRTASDLTQGAGKAGEQGRKQGAKN